MLPFILLCLAALLFWLALRLRRTTGIPWQRVAASDTGGFQPLDRPLFARRYGLTGKPDYLLRHGQTFVPVEVKPTRQAHEPYQSDIWQLMAYCVLVEETTGRAPPYGLLRYATDAFRIAYTSAVRDELLALLDDMRSDLDAPDCARSHNEPRRCAGCGFADMCAESLVDEPG